MTYEEIFMEGYLDAIEFLETSQITKEKQRKLGMNGPKGGMRDKYHGWGTTERSDLQRKRNLAKTRANTTVFEKKKGAKIYKGEILNNGKTKGYSIQDTSRYSLDGKTMQQRHIGISGKF